jgi:hypothetical protein
MERKNINFRSINLKQKINECMIISDFYNRTDRTENKHTHTQIYINCTNVYFFAIQMYNFLFIYTSNKIFPFYPFHIFI